MPADSLLAMVRGWNAGLARWQDFDEVVFWLEHDLFDQLILLRHLHWLSTLDAARTDLQPHLHRLVSRACSRSMVLGS